MMNKGSKIVSASIIGADFVNVTVNGKCYTVFSPTVHKLCTFLILGMNRI